MQLLLRYADAFPADLAALSAAVASILVDPAVRSPAPRAAQSICHMRV
jgi:hypothetical protein